MRRTSTAHASTIALVAGIALTTDVVTIAILDRNFGLLDNLLFFLGLTCGLVSLGLLPAVWSRDRPHRAWLVVAGFLLLAGGVVGSAGFGEWLIPAVYSGDNIISTEGAVLLVGLFWVVVGLAARRRTPPVDRPAGLVWAGER
jgi:hypothetical protein